MLTQYEYTRGYLFMALESVPAIFAHILLGVGEDEADIRPDPQRFTIREAVAHMAEFERTCLLRFQLTREGSQPTLPRFDDTPHLAAYARSEPLEQVELFSARRMETISFLESCSPIDWNKMAHRVGMGEMTLEAQALLIPLHDTYHVSQIVDWRSRYGQPNCQG